MNVTSVWFGLPKVVCLNVTVAVNILYKNPIFDVQYTWLICLFSSYSLEWMATSMLSWEMVVQEGILSTVAKTGKKPV